MLWMKVISCKYGIGRIDGTPSRRVQLYQSPLKHISGLLLLFLIIFAQNVGKGGCIRFWIDPWINNLPLSVSFWRIFNLPQCQKARFSHVAIESQSNSSCNLHLHVHLEM